MKKLLSLLKLNTKKPNFLINPIKINIFSSKFFSITNKNDDSAKKSESESDDDLPIDKYNPISIEKGENIGNENDSESKTTNENDTKISSIPLIYWNHPVLPYSQFKINNPNRNDLFFGLLLKYGKINVIDENLTIIEDICLLYEKEDLFKIREKEREVKETKDAKEGKEEKDSQTKENDYMLAYKCKVSYTKDLLLVNITDKIYKISSTIRPGKYRFFNSLETPEFKINIPDLKFLLTLMTANHHQSYNSNLLENNNENEKDEKEKKDEKEEKERIDEEHEKKEYILSYADKCISTLRKSIEHIKTIEKILDLSEEYFGNNEMKFLFTIKDMNDILEYYTNQSNTIESLSNIELFEHLIKLFYDYLPKYSNYLLLKTYIFSNLVYDGHKNFNKLTQMTDILNKLLEIDSNLQSIEALLSLKYNFYKFNKTYKFNISNPFSNKTKEEYELILKYKDVIEMKISDVDSIEKEKNGIIEKINKIKSIPVEVRSVINKEISKISSVNYESENSKRIEYLNHIVNLPWDNYDTPQWDISYAKRVLDSNLYGLDETKERIYEFIAKNMRTNNKKGCILLLSGGPGTGKTRIAKLIGEALQRKVGFISLAGISDGKTILGFKRTYIASTPGVFIREMQKVNTMNPVIVIDEIDKVNIRYGHSNVFNSLLQLMNPEENSRFTDHYLEIPFDFSNVIFILTSNNNEIFAPLLDRMEIIQVDPYVYYEKMIIAKNYALKQILKEYHLENLEITDAALYKLIYTHCKNEAGVRKLKKLLETIVRKITVKIETKEYKDYIKGDVSEEKLLEYLQINSENILQILDEVNNDDVVLSDMISKRHETNETGQCVGLFVSKTDQLNSWGDASLFSVYLTEKIKNKLKLKLNEKYIDKTSITSEINEKNSNSNDENKDNKPTIPENKYEYKVNSTGNLGEDSIQSFQIAIELAAEKLNSIDKKKYRNFFLKKEIHYDCPQILQQKSGPSAGVIAYLCIMSASLEIPIIPNLAMTGEVGIDGSVLKIGGVKEKCQGAQRYGIKTLVLPKGNKNDFLELQSNLKNSFEKVYFAENVDEIYMIGFGKDTKGVDYYEKVNEEVKIEEILTEEVIRENNILNNMF